MAAPAGLPIDGSSLAPWLRTDPTSWPDRMLFMHRGNWQQFSAPYPGSVRTQRFSLINGKELYEIPRDPGERHDVSGEYQKEVARLRNAYDDWFRVAADQCRFERPPIPVGYREENPVVLAAPQAYLRGKLRFFQGAGWAHDWITGWENIEDRVNWELEVVRPGRYEVSLEYLCAREDRGAVVEVTASRSAVSGKITEATLMTPKPSRDLVPRKEAPEMNWGVLSLGGISLPAGRVTLSVRPLSKPGRVVMDLKALSLEFV